jgi:hypothetical protein
MACGLTACSLPTRGIPLQSSGTEANRLRLRSMAPDDDESRRARRNSDMTVDESLTR